MASFTNQTKNSSTVENQNISGIAQWADTVATWAAALFSWGGVASVYTNETKNSSNITNQTKN